MGSADVVVFGEVHDNPVHHANQARAVIELRPGALVFEQVPPALGSQITPELIQNATDLEALLRWHERGWPDFAMYYPIFAAASSAAIFGGEAPKDDVRTAIGEGAAAAFGEGAALFGLDQAFPAEAQEEQEQIQRQAHCDALPDEMLPGMVQAQRLRDATLARAAIAAHHETLARGAEGPVIVITGNGHAGNGLAVPDLLRKADPDLVVVSVAQFEESAPPDPDFDYWLVTQPAQREDPCAAFK